MRVLDPILRQIRSHPTRPLVVDDQRVWTGFQLWVGSLHLARAIARQTDCPHIGVMLPTSGLFPMALLAVWRLGRTLVPVNYLLGDKDRAYVINDAAVDAVITVGPMLEHTGDLPGECAALRLDDMSFSGLPPWRPRVRRDDDHLAVILYTSGTSGKPKGVMLTSGNLATNVQQTIDFICFTDSDVLVGVLPQFHSFGLTVLTLLPLSLGCRAVYTAKFLPKRILKLIEEQRGTALVAIPSMYNALMNAKSARREHLATLRLAVSGGEPLPDAVVEGFDHKFGVTITEGYGLTETGPVANVCLPAENKPGSVGRALAKVEEKIVDTEGRRLGPNTEGEICIKGPNVMRGYYNLPDETAAVFDDEGFFRTGDMGRVDEDGYLSITGRIKEMLIIGGENVFPREIEDVLDRHPSVYASAVIGRHDDSRGETALAFVELAEEAEFDETALRSHCREHLAQYKVPREIRRIDALPRNPTGKIMRRELTLDSALPSTDHTGDGA